MTITVTTPDYSPDAQLLWVNQQILGDIKKARQEAVKAEMLPKKGPFDLYVRQGNKLTKRKEHTLDPRFMKIGTNTKPTEYEYITEASWQTVVDAVHDAWALVRRRSPFETGNYLSMTSLYVNDRRSTIGTFDKTNRDPADAVVSIANITPYATALENGFYAGSYHNGQYKGEGIYLWVARELRRKYGNSISLRFTFTTVNGRAVPAVEIAAAGVFAGNDTKPGRGSKRRRGRKR